jgi:hypothetical protein
MPRLVPVKLVSLSACAVLFACDDPSALEFADDPAIESRDGPGNGGPVFNTNVLVDTEVPAVDTNGVSIGGVSLVSVRYLRLGVLTSLPVSSLRVDHGTLKTTLLQKYAPSGAGFVGSVWTFDVGGKHVEATLATVETSASAGLYQPTLTSKQLKLDPERLVYTFHFENELDQYVHTCADDDDAGARMVLYGDLIVDEVTGDVSQRPDTIYFGCISGAVGKAALWGYAPDSPSLTSVSLDGFTTAVRTVRADYCADGKSYTEVGNMLTLRDSWGINDAPELGFSTEAVWEEGGGAVCVSRVRETGQALHAPFQCVDGTTIPLCQADAALSASWNGGYGDVWTKIPP